MRLPRRPASCPSNGDAPRPDWPGGVGLSPKASDGCARDRPTRHGVPRVTTAKFASPIRPRAPTRAREPLSPPAMAPVPVLRRVFGTGGGGVSSTSRQSASAGWRQRSYWTRSGRVERGHVDRVADADGELDGGVGAILGKCRCKGKEIPPVSGVSPVSSLHTQREAAKRLPPVAREEGLERNERGAGWGHPTRNVSGGAGR